MYDERITRDQLDGLVDRLRRCGLKLPVGVKLDSLDQLSLALDVLAGGDGNDVGVEAQAPAMFSLDPPRRTDPDYEVLRRADRDASRYADQRNRQARRGR